MNIIIKIQRGQNKLTKLNAEIKQLEKTIENLIVKANMQCPVHLICQCPRDNNWDGVCKLLTNGK
jgi:hypothetical protein